MVSAIGYSSQQVKNVKIVAVASAAERAALPVARTWTRRSPVDLHCLIEFCRQSKPEKPSAGTCSERATRRYRRR